jgi:hypothetical protein
MREILKYKIFSNSIGFEKWQLENNKGYKDIKQIKPLIAETKNYKDHYNDTTELINVAIFVLYSCKEI